MNEAIVIRRGHLERLSELVDGGMPAIEAMGMLLDEEYAKLKAADPEGYARREVRIRRAIRQN